jgi:regulator of ribonuclease activity A
MTSTADILDQYRDQAFVCTLDLQQFGGVRSFQGSISTVRCHEDNVLVRQRVSEPGAGRILVVDGGGSLRVALLGDTVAGTARDNGWAGIVVHGCVRDVGSLAELDLGIKAIRACPRPSKKDGAGELDVPVTFGEVTFSPGATLYSDDDGIVVLAASV